MRNIIIFTISVLLIILLISLTGAVFYGAKTISDLFTENKKLKEAITNLSNEDQIGYAKVINQTKSENGKILSTKIRFVETDRNDKMKKILDKEFEIEGNIVHFDAFIVTFPTQYVMDGKEKSIYIWRRIYGEYMKPSDGYSIEDPNVEPKRYENLLNKLYKNEKKMFWDAIWSLSDNEEALKEYRIKAAYGNVVYKELKPGLIYIFKISNTGQLSPETVLDIDDETAKSINRK